MAKRKLIKEIVIKRYERIQKFSNNSQEAIKWFEQNGRRVEAMPVLVQNGDSANSGHVLRTIHQITAKSLLPRTKNAKIEHAMRFLEYVNKIAFEDTTKEDVEKFKKSVFNVR